MKSGVFKPSILQSFSAGIVGVVAGILAGWLVGLDLGIWALFLAVPYGTAAGEVILRACGRKRGRLLEIIAGISFAIGAVGGRVVIGFIVVNLNPQITHNLWAFMAEAFAPFPIGPIALAVALSCIVSRIRYL
jgi:hypothetical protein